MSKPIPDGLSIDRRTFLKTTGAITAGAAVLPSLGCLPREGSLAEALAAAEAGWTVQPFHLTQVTLGDGIFRAKRDRMLNYARSYGGEGDIYAGPDRVLSIFRANAGLDTKGAEPVGSWENATGYLRGHYAGHFMSMLAQAYASTGEGVFKEKLDYMVGALAQCQASLAAAAEHPTPRVPGRRGRALKLSGSPIGQAEHLSLPNDLLTGLQDFTISTWIKPLVNDRDAVSDPRTDTVELTNRSAVFSFGTPNPEYAEAPMAHMYLTVRASNENPVPRFAITTTGAEGEQALEGAEPLHPGEWVHLAISRSGNLGTFFINGVPVATNPGMTLAPADLGPPTVNWLGRHQFPQRNVSYLNGELDDFQIYSRALDEDELRRAMEPGEEGWGGDVAWYRFEEEGGPTAVDSSGRGRDATIIAPTDGRRHPGFLSAYPETQFIRLEEFATYGGSQGIWAPYYTLHKIMAGLIDAHVHTGNDEALELLMGMGDWVHQRLAPLPQESLDRMWNIYIAGEYGGVNESLAYLHALRPGKQEYLDAAECFVNNNVYAPTVINNDVLDGRHANQHIPQFTGYLRTFEQGHDENFLLAAKNFWDMIVPHRTYSHGGVGVGEMFRERDVIAGSLFHDRNHAETCPLYNMLKLSRNLFFHDPDPKYMNYYELGLFNQMAGSRRDRDSSDSPEVTYFVPVQPGQRRRYGNVGTCCGGTGMESHTKYQDSIYFRSVDTTTLYVNLYIASTLRWPEKGFTIVQETEFPREGSATLTVDGQGALDIKLRVPTWVQRGFHVSINDVVQEVEATPGTYLTLSRRWGSGDRVQIDMPFSFRTEGTVDEASVQSLFYGPTLLAAQGEPVGDELGTGLLKVGFYEQVGLDGDLARAMTPTEKPLHFSSGGLTFVPFHLSDPDSPTQPYHIYFRRHEPQVVFGSVGTGVPNPVRSDGWTFLDAVWRGAPFESPARFVVAVEEATREWEGQGLLSERDGATILTAAREAAHALQPS